MVRLEPYKLLIGNASDCRDSARVRSLGIVAVIDLAVNEPPPVLSRELTVCRFPLHDGMTNPNWLLAAAIDCVAGFVRANVPTLVCCSAGMSRAPTIASTGIAKATGRSPAEVLREIQKLTHVDVSPGLLACSTAAINPRDFRFDLDSNEKGGT
jgi:hypothetical protein